MSGGWERTHRRYELVGAVFEAVARSAPRVPDPLLRRIDEEYGDFGTFLLDVRRRRHQTFDARLDLLLENPPDNLDEAVRELWREVDRDFGAARVLLDANATHPALAALDEHHRRSLSMATAASVRTA